MANDNPNWTQDSRGQWHWTPTKEMRTVRERPIDPLRQGGGYFCVYDENGHRRDDRVRLG